MSCPVIYELTLVRKSFPKFQALSAVSFHKFQKSKMKRGSNSNHSKRSKETHSFSGEVDAPIYRKIKAHPGEFKYRTLRNDKSLQQIYDGTAATGQFSRSSSMGMLEDNGDKHFDEVGGENFEISSDDDGLFVTEISVSDKGSSKNGGLKRKKTNKGKKLDWVDSAMHNWAESYVAKDENYWTTYHIMLGSGVEFHDPHPPAPVNLGLAWN